MLPRIVVVAACVSALVLLGHRRADAEACDDARAALFAADARGAAPTELVATVRDRCRDPDEVALAAVGVASAHHPRAAAMLARTAIDRAPDGFSGWAALALALTGRDPVGAARAARRAHELNPRWRAPAPAHASGAAGS